MAWVAPRTWTAAETVTAAMMNTLRDSLKAIGDAWTSYSPGWTATSDPAIGNGSLSGVYMQAGKLVHYRIRCTMGSTTTYGSGTWLFGLPVQATSAPTAGNIYGHAILFDTSGATRRGWMAFTTAGVSNTAIGDPAALTTLVNPTTPWTWANGDSIAIAGTYEAA